MKVSIVTAVHNRAETIEHAVKSVQAQTYGNVEHIIQDGGSDDGTLERIRELADSRTVVESTADGGVYHAINRGIERATGDIIGLMHSDDCFASNDALSSIVSRLESTGADGVYGDLDYVSRYDPDRVIRRWRSGPYSPDDLERGWMPPHPTVYLKRDVYRTWGSYDPKLSIAADYDAMLRWLKDGDIKLEYIPRVLVKMRWGGASNGTLLQILRKSREDYMVIRKNGIGGVRTLIRKNTSKFGQFFLR